MGGERNGGGLRGFEHAFLWQQACSEEDFIAALGAWAPSRKIDAIVNDDGAARERRVRGGEIAAVEFGNPERADEAAILSFVTRMGEGAFARLRAIVPMEQNRRPAQCLSNAR